MEFLKNLENAIEGNLEVQFKNVNGESLNIKGSFIDEIKIYLQKKVSTVLYKIVYVILFLMF